MARTTPRRRTALALTGLTAAVATGLAAWTGTSWYAAAHDDSAAFAQTRDEVLAAGEQAVQNLNTLDHRDLEQGLDTWERSATGDLLAELRNGRDAFADQVGKARTVTTAKVLSGAVTELDQRAGRAGVLIAVRITVDPADDEPSSKQSRLLGELTRTGDGWKLSALGQAPAGDTTAHQ
ncbi:Mce-associated membrane protein [Streptomyces sp. SLBN-118]|uniref:hypothetical protein n=1 Tax=Streptomyces sp. SLBN-118 TaxID=2768454 RepID=UPI001172FCB2|nr:hypothetical protein [Streptomyces sp. SLBN-118]TQK51711.1 Mce-associated membrane protein [Streptomyces sp. SLBN-118]